MPTTSKQATSRKPRQILPHSDKIDFAIAKVLELFTADEIRTGVFGDEKSRGVNRSTSRPIFKYRNFFSFKIESYSPS